MPCSCAQFGRECMKPTNRRARRSCARCAQAKQKCLDAVWPGEPVDVSTELKSTGKELVEALKRMGADIDEKLGRLVEVMAQIAGVVENLTAAEAADRRNDSDTDNLNSEAFTGMRRRFRVHKEEE